jgi:hypothetical protein
MRPARRVRASILVLVTAIAAGAAPAVSVAADPVLDVVSINGGAYGTNSLNVTVSAPWAGAVTMRLSNDGVAWSAQMAYATSVPWALDDPATGGTSAIGTHSVWVEWYDGADVLLATGWDNIYYDVTPPVQSNLRVRIEPGKTVSTGGAVPFVVAWFDDDLGGAGVMNWDAEMSVDGGAWIHIASPINLPGFRYGFVSGHSYRVRVRGIDLAGNVGDWYVGPAFTVKGYQESSGAMKWTGTWSKLSSTSYWGGASKTTTVAGATAKLTFTGRRVALVTRVGTNRGAIAIYINGVKQATVDLRASTTGLRRVVWEKTWTTSASRTILVKLVKVPNRSTRADVDAIVTGN